MEGIEKYENMRRCADATGTPYALLKLAKNRLDAPGFNRSSGSARINWSELKPWLDAHRLELEEEAKEGSVDALKKEKLVLENKLKRLEIKKKEGSQFEPEDFYKFFGDFGTELSTHLKKVRKDLMEQCQGYESVIDHAFISLFTVINEKERQCRKQ